MMLLLLQDAEQGGHHDLQQQLQRPGAPGAQGGDQVGVSGVRCWWLHGTFAVARELILDEHVECGCKCGPGEIKDQDAVVTNTDCWRSSPIHG